METGPWLRVSSDRLVKLGIEPATPGLRGLSKKFVEFVNKNKSTSVDALKLLHV